MSYNTFKDTKFKAAIKLKKNQLQWIKENKKAMNCKTAAGFLDLIINHFKKYDMQKLRRGDGMPPAQSNKRQTP